MGTKLFEVGQVWRTRGGEIRTIEVVETHCDDQYPVRANGDWFTIEGRYLNAAEGTDDLVELVTNADGMPASAEAAASQINPSVYDPTRTEFIDKLTESVFYRAAIEGIPIANAEQYINAAVTLRDKLVRGEQ